MRINNLLEFGNYCFGLIRNVVSTLTTFGLESSNSFHVRQYCHWVGDQPSLAWGSHRGVLTSARMGSLKRHSAELCRLGMVFGYSVSICDFEGIIHGKVFTDYCSFVSTLTTFGLESSNSFHVRRYCHWVGNQPSSAWGSHKGVLTSAWMGSPKRHSAEPCRLGMVLGYSVSICDFAGNIHGKVFADCCF
ncbi:hypothetical protein CDAR_559031 [Caerostris darwini]|uniref:Uncharacterized protein n=1 Tax=Caerostris darwini TaxID=1538125 RepID=A0AAV4TA18_9ARAC|nr:hypothetical protein CDAR_559031 [Caerostris darwini]